MVIDCTFINLFCYVDFIIFGSLFILEITNMKNKIKKNLKSLININVVILIKGNKCGEN